MSVDTAHVTRPRTGFPFLDAGLDNPRSVLAFAHRGGAFHPGLEGLENTMAAFQHAVDLGYQYLETDVHATKDGHLLAIHDAFLDRVTASRGAISELDRSEVAEALIAGKEQIPAMASLLEQFPDTRFNIDLKSDAAVDPLADLVQSMNAYDRVCIASFVHRRIERFRTLVGKRVATAAAPFDVGLFRFLASTQIIDVLTRQRAAALQIPHRRGGVTILTPGLVARAHALGKHVHVWTVDEPDQMRELLDMGVDGLMTDRTDVLREVLIERGQWMGAPR